MLWLVVFTIYNYSQNKHIYSVYIYTSILFLIYKKGDKEELVPIIGILTPVMKKYLKYLYKDDPEDIHEEFILAVMIALNKMHYIKSEGECMNYLVGSIKMKFYELYRKSVKKNDLEELKSEFVIEAIQDLSFENISFSHDMKQFSLIYNTKTQEIFLDFVLNEYTETQLSHKYNTTRQYMHKLKKSFYKNLAVNYFGSYTKY